MDPRRELRVDDEFLRGLHPLQRARMNGEAAEKLEAKQAEARRAAKQAEIEGHLHQLEVRERQELVQRGYTTAELLQLRAQESADREEKVAELEAELAALNPQRAQARRAEMMRAVQRAEDERVLAEAQRSSADGYMRSHVRRLEQRRAAEVSRSRPFASRSGVSCEECAAAGATPEESAQIHRGDGQVGREITRGIDDAAIRVW